MFLCAFVSPPRTDPGVRPPGVLVVPLSLASNLIRQTPRCCRDLSSTMLGTRMGRLTPDQRLLVGVVRDESRRSVLCRVHWTIRPTSWGVRLWRSVGSERAAHFACVSDDLICLTASPVSKRYLNVALWKCSSLHGCGALLLLNDTTAKRDIRSENKQLERVLRAVARRQIAGDSALVKRDVSETTAASKLHRRVFRRGGGTLHFVRNVRWTDQLFRHDGVSQMIDRMEFFHGRLRETQRRTVQLEAECANLRTEVDTLRSSSVSFRSSRPRPPRRRSDKVR